jgi:hypothetical protein
MNRYLTIILVVCGFLTMNAQVDKQKQLQREKDKVTLFTPEERANLQLWFYEQTQKMGLSEELNDEYNRIFYGYIYEMGRLNDKDLGMSDAEIRKEFELLVDKLNGEMKQLLSKDQYIQHLENFGEIVRKAYRRVNWND